MGIPSLQHQWRAGVAIASVDDLSQVLSAHMGCVFRVLVIRVQEKGSKTDSDDFHTSVLREQQLIEVDCMTARQWPVQLHAYSSLTPRKGWQADAGA